jgi:hypothetical protein
VEKKSDVAGQIHVLLRGLEMRAKRAGLASLASELSAVAKKAERLAKDVDRKKP